MQKSTDRAGRSPGAGRLPACRSRLRRIVMSSVMRLEPETRAVMTAYFYGGSPVSEIAAMTGRPEAEVLRRLCRGTEFVGSAVRAEKNRELNGSMTYVFGEAQLPLPVSGGHGKIPANELTEMIRAVMRGGDDAAPRMPSRAARRMRKRIIRAASCRSGSRM
jgi:hypothetical protein